MDKYKIKLKSNNFKNKNMEIPKIKILNLFLKNFKNDKLMVRSCSFPLLICILIYYRKKSTKNK